MPRYSKPRYRKPRTLKRASHRAHRCHVIQPSEDVNVRAAARFTCAAIRHGHSKASIDRAIQQRCNVGAPECDCERALLVLRQVLTMAATVSVLVAVSTALVTTVPVLILRRIPVLGVILGRLLQNTVLRRITQEADFIEGTFFRVREEVQLIEQSLLRARSSG